VVGSVDLVRHDGSAESENPVGLALAFAQTLRHLDGGREDARGDHEQRCPLAAGQRLALTAPQLGRRDVLVGQAAHVEADPAGVDRDGSRDVGREIFDRR
jgi:hypothetical protein